MSRPSIASASLPYLALVGSMVAFSVGTSFGKQLFPQVGAPGTVALRVGFSAILLLAAFRPWRQRLPRTDLFAIMRYGAVMGLMNFSFYMAIRTIPLGLAIAIEFLGPLSVSLLHSRSPAHFAVVALAAAGLAMLLPFDGMDQALDPVGLFFALCSGACWALYIIFGKRVGHIKGGQGVALGMATAALVVVPIGVVDAGAALLAPSVVAIGLGTAILSSALPYSLEMVALKRIPARRFGIMMSLEPAAGTVAGAVILGEHLSPLQLLAIALVVGASVGSVLFKGKTGTEAHEQGLLV